MARKFWDVPMEMIHEELGLLIGSAFVLGQATLTQSIAIVGQLHRLSGQHASIPTGKRELLETEVERDPQTNLSRLVIIDTAANFFKHHHEWSSDWHSSPGKGVQAKTIADAYAIGFRGHELTDNMYVALRRLAVDEHDMSKVAATIQGWREGLARRFGRSLETPID